MVYVQRAGDKGEDSAVLPTIRVTQRVASGTGGGSSTGGMHTRALNTVETNSITGASLSGSSVSLPAGAYKVRGSAPASGSQSAKHQVRIVINNGTTILGTSENAPPAYATRSFAEGDFVAGSAVTVALQHYISTTQAGYGQGIAVGDTTEVYAEMTIEKVA